jgi:hypothetical protein
MLTGEPKGGPKRGRSLIIATRGKNGVFSPGARVLLRVSSASSGKHVSPSGIVFQPPWRVAQGPVPRAETEEREDLKFCGALWERKAETPSRGCWP